MIGFMGVGKTSTSRILSKKLGVKENDTDAMIVKQEKKSIAEIFADEGEEYFRKTETGIIDKLAELEPCIVSCGGGMAMREVNVEKMKKIGKVVLLTATPETIYSHVKDSTNRPLLNGNMNVPFIQNLMESRREKYERAADIVIDTTGKEIEEICEELLQKLSALRK